MMLTGKQRYKQAVLKATILRMRSIRQAERDQKAGRSWMIRGQTDRKCLEAELERAYEAGVRDGAIAERASNVAALRIRARDRRRSASLYDDEASRVSCLEDAIEAHSCADAIERRNT